MINCPDIMVHGSQKAACRPLGMQGASGLRDTPRKSVAGLCLENQVV